VRFEAKTYLSGWGSEKRLAHPGPFGLATLVLVLATLAAGLAPNSASARATRSYESSFNPSVGELEQGETQGIAVDQPNGDVYAVTDVNFGAEEGTISRFDSSGAPKNFTAGPDAGTNTLTGIRSIGDVAIDSSGGPLDGTIYVVEGGNDRAVRVFASNGESRGALTGFGTLSGSFQDLGGVAVDQANGDVYIGDTKIWRYAPKSPTGSIDDADFTVTGISARFNGDASHSGHIAVGQDAIYTTESFDGNPPHGGIVKRFPLAAFTPDAPEASGTSIEDEGLPLRAGTLAVDPETDDLYAGQSNRVSVISSSGVLLYRFGASHYFGEHSGGIGVKSAESGAAAKVYVSESLQLLGGEVAVFGPLTQVITRTHPTIASFGKDGSAGTSFDLPDGSSLSALTLSFDQSDRKLYAYDPSIPGIRGFDAASPPAYPPLAAFSPISIPGSKFGAGLAVDNTGLSSAGNVYLSAYFSPIYGYSSSGAPLGGAFPIDPTVTPGVPGGSPAGFEAAAVDSSGNIWVTNFSTERILEYSSAGVYLSSVDTSAQGVGPASIAFDSDNNLYVVFRYSRGIWKYSAPAYGSPTQIAPKLRDTRIGVDLSTDHLYASQNGRVEEYDSAGNFLEEFATEPLKEEVLRGITVDAVTHEVYVADDSRRQIRVFGPGVVLPDLALMPTSAITDTAVTLNANVGAQTVAISDCHFEYVKESAYRTGGFADLSTGGSAPCPSVPTDLEDHAISVPAGGLSPNTIYRYRLSAANANGSLATSVATFTTLGPPLAETTGAPVRSATTARLEGRVDPSGSPASFHFEYGEQGPCDSNPCSSTEAVSAGAGNVYELAATEISGLQPGATYHYRVVADNGNPGSPAFGQDMTVTTRATDAPLSHGHFPGPPGSDRAYEQVNLPDTGGNPVGEGDAFSDDGNRAVYITAGGNPSSPIGTVFSQFFAERVETAAHRGGWQSTAVMPPRDQLSGGLFLAPSGPSDLSSFAVLNGDAARLERSIWRLSPTTPPQKLFEPVAPQEYRLWYSGSDASTRVVVRLRGGVLDPAYPAAATHENIYDVSDGTPKLASLLPGNVPSDCDIGDTGGQAFGLPQPSGTETSNWLSADGELLFFPGGCGNPNLYMRELEAGQTKLVSGPPLSGGDCGAILIKTNAQAAFFWTQSRLAAKDTDPPSCGTNSTPAKDIAGGDVYRYDIASATLDCLTCLTQGVDADVYPGALSNFGEVPRNVAVAEDGSRIYFQSPSRLAPGAPSLIPGEGGSIYRLEVKSGDLRWIARSQAGVGDAVGGNTATTPDGSVIVFRAQAPSLNQLGGGTDNGATSQYYRYDDRDRSLLCISCPPDGSAARAETPFRWVSSTGQSGANITPISDDGTVFFPSPGALVGADQNTAGTGQDPLAGTDIYEWRDGRPLLVTDGLTNWSGGGLPVLQGVSPSGRDAYFTAAIQYTQDAIDGYRRLYDARIGGGFEFPAPPKPCPLEVCQGTPKGAPEEQAPGTGSFAGPGNTNSPAKGKKKAHKNKKKIHKKHSHKSKRQHKANNNRGAQR
jgi:hypothetical protein